MHSTSAHPDPPLYLGVDVGGTNVKMGLVDEQGRVIASTQFPTRQHLGPEYAVEQTRQHFQLMLLEHRLSVERIQGAGLGTPGTMDIPRGLILEPPNLPGWRHFPIRACLQESIELPVTYANDANAAAFGEFWVGAGREFTSMLLITLGTGIGGGIVIGDELIDGAHSLGGEIGHVTIDWADSARICSCGRRGHLEAYASATALVGRAKDKQLFKAGPASAEVALGDLTAKSISDAAEQGNAMAVDLVLDVADWLARGIAIAAHLVDPQAIMLGGAMNFGGSQSQLGRRFLQRIQTKVKEFVFPEISSSLAIDFAQLGSDAGFIGAAGLAREQHRRKLNSKGIPTGINV